MRFVHFSLQVKLQIHHLVLFVKLKIVLLLIICMHFPLNYVCWSSLTPCSFTFHFLMASHSLKMVLPKNVVCCLFPSYLICSLFNVHVHSLRECLYQWTSGTLNLQRIIEKSFLLKKLIQYTNFYVSKSIIIQKECTFLEEMLVPVNLWHIEFTEHNWETPYLKKVTAKKKTILYLEKMFGVY